MFILTAKAIEAINNTTGIRAKLSLALGGISVGSIYRFIRENEPNNDLTKYAALQVIRKETGLPDKEILKAVVDKKTLAKVTAK